MKEAFLKVQVTERRWFIRFLEIIPGLTTWLFLLSPIILSLLEPVWVAYFIIAFDLVWLLKSMRLSVSLIRGYRRLYRLERLDWNAKLDWLKDIGKARQGIEQEIYKLIEKHPKSSRRFQWTTQGLEQHARYERLADDLKEIRELQERESNLMRPENIYNAVILATYNESLETLEPSVKALAEAPYPLKQIMLVIAYEERGGAETEKNALYLIERYGKQFAYAAAIKHPDGLAGEVRGKGGNITFAGRELTKHILAQGIDPEQVIVTTFDADHRASKNYFSYLSYAYATNVNRTRKSYQPIPMFYNNIWDAPAPMRVIATGNSFWMIMESMRPHRLRNFAAHAQSLKALIDTDFWSVTTIVEDGHQYWRTYFTYDGDHQVVPLYTPVYQDAVLAEGYVQTYKAQYLQLRRWAWGISDFPYVVINCLKNPRIPGWNKAQQVFRLFEGHFSWATAPLIVTFVAWMPLYLNRDFSDTTLAHLLPVIASRIMTLAMIGLIVTVLISLISLPPKPARYRRSRSIFMLTQWVLIPVTGILFNAVAAIDAQTRLMFGRYMEFRVTEKAVISDKDDAAGLRDKAVKS